MTGASRRVSRQRYFAFIRAINVGGRRLTNIELVKPFIEAGFKDVSAYQAAGNITFKSDDSDMRWTETLQPALTKAYGFETPVFVRTHAELCAVNHASPFSDEELAATEGRIQVSFMHSTPDEAAVAAVLALSPVGERVVFSGREWFWLPERGISSSQLPISAIEGLVGPMTIRTLGTVARMLSRFS